jgi:ketosteroid isomerase-like protein
VLRLWLAMGVGVAALMVSGLLASMAKAQAGVDPAAVVSAYEMARNRRDIDTALDYFADDATISQRSTTFTGKDEIRKFLDGISARSRFVVVSDRRVSGNRVSWTERAGNQGPSPQGQPMSLAQQGSNGNPNGNASAFMIGVEAVVQDGKIHSLAYMPASQPLRTDPTLDGRAQLPASVGLGAVLAVLLGVLMVASAGLSRRGASASSLRGRLMHDLQGWSAARQ